MVTPEYNPWPQNGQFPARLLETQWGKQYRVEVEFGDTESVDTGGSVWIEFTSPGRNYGTVIGLGGASDHNREDGRTFTDFKHNDSDVKSYFVTVAAYDQYNGEDSLTYNGPYTITLTGITGVTKMVSNIASSLGSPVDYETGLNLSDGDTITLATPFVTGADPRGYTLDRIKVPFDNIADNGASPSISVHLNSSDTPTTKLCDMEVPAKIVESARTHGGYPPPYEFLAGNCAYSTLDASTPYWVVFTGVDPAAYTLKMTNSAAEHDYGTGWTMDNFLARSTDGGASRTVTPANIGNIRIEYWAKPSTSNATGEPLARGQRFLQGQELTAGPGTVSDPDGTSRANYRYQWMRTDDQGVSTNIKGATGATYTITNDDIGHRVGVRVSFLDNAGNSESRTSMATSYIPAPRRVLVSNLGRPDSGGVYPRNPRISQGFTTAAGDQKYRVWDAKTKLDANNSGNLRTDRAKIRLFTSGNQSSPVDRTPVNEIATLKNPDQLSNGGTKQYTAPTHALLDGGTTYHLVMTSGGTGNMNCILTTNTSPDSSSKPGWDILQRVWKMATEDTVSTGYGTDGWCKMAIRGHQLADAPHITSLEITSTPSAGPSYETGETIQVTATLSEAVGFTGPEPILRILIGANTREAVRVASLSATTQWVFEYVVEAGDRDDDGISIEQHALRAYAGADLSHNAISTAPSHRVNAQRCCAPSGSPPGLEPPSGTDPARPCSSPLSSPCRSP